MNQNWANDLVNPELKDALVQSFNDGADDTTINVSVTYDVLTGSTPDFDTGVVARTETSFTLNALRRMLSEKEVNTGPGSLQVGDREYMIDLADFTGTVPTTNDRITEGSDQLSVYLVQKDPFEIFYRIVARANN